MLPFDKKLDTRVLAQIYNNTAATYKFYWFVSLLDIFVKKQQRRISFWEIIVGMIAEAWYPIHYFRLSFGKSDSLYERIIQLQQELNIPIDISREGLKYLLINKLGNASVKSILRIFTQNVPYWFLSPWINSKTPKEVVIQSQNLHNSCLYKIIGETIELNPHWETYLIDNYSILRDFSFWNLTIFLQKRNPNVPDVPSKLVKPIQRDSLNIQRKFWNIFIDISGSMQCIYTGKTLYKKGYDLDHFVPWSFVSHNLLWNLLPVDSSINSSKSNNLPPLDVYLRPFAKMHQKALQNIYPKHPNNKLFEDYLSVYDSVSELATLSEDDFLRVYKKTFSPLVQIAENMGFKYWQKCTN
jgi:hypothetical protein